MKKTIPFITCAMLMFILAIGTFALAGEIPGKDSIYLTLVNKEHGLPEDWLDQIELVTEYDPWGDEVQVESVTLEHFNALRDKLLKKYNIDIRIDSAYRSIPDQEETWAYFRDLHGEEYCAKYLAKPGYSEHHTGLAIDICLAKDGEIINDNEAMIADEETFAIIHRVMPEYGFILRYPLGAEDYTGYTYEPWHLRYVGEIPAAEIAVSHLTLEEYLTRDN